MVSICRHAHVTNMAERLSVETRHALSKSDLFQLPI